MNSPVLHRGRTGGSLPENGPKIRRVMLILLNGGPGQGALRGRVVGPRLRAEGLPGGLRQSVCLHRLDQGHRRAFCGVKLSPYGLVVLAALNDVGITQPFREKFALQ